MTDAVKTRLRIPLRPIVAILAALRIPPNAVTVTGLLLSVASGIALSQGRFLFGGILLLISGLCDTLDGELARRSGLVSRRGGFLDSSFDRLSEFAVFFGLFWHFREQPSIAALIFGTLFASVAVSYVRARAEGIGLECRVGLFERPVRFVFLILGVFLTRHLAIALWVILAGSVLAVIQRLVHVMRRTC